MSVADSGSSPARHVQPAHQHSKVILPQLRIATARRREQGNCGYLPCLVCRAALARIRRDRADDYAWDALSDADLLDPIQRRAPPNRRPA